MVGYFGYILKVEVKVFFFELGVRCNMKSGIKIIFKVFNISKR